MIKNYRIGKTPSKINILKYYFITLKPWKFKKKKEKNLKILANKQPFRVANIYMKVNYIYILAGQITLPAFQLKQLSRGWWLLTTHYLPTTSTNPLSPF